MFEDVTERRVSRRDDSPRTASSLAFVNEAHTLDEEVRLWFEKNSFWLLVPSAGREDNPAPPVSPIPGAECRDAPLPCAPDGSLRLPEQICRSQRSNRS